MVSQIKVDKLIENFTNPTEVIMPLVKWYSLFYGVSYIESIKSIRSALQSMKKDEELFNRTYP